MYLSIIGSPNSPLLISRGKRLAPPLAPRPGLHCFLRPQVWKDKLKLLQFPLQLTAQGEEVEQNWPTYKVGSGEDGSICCYADDTILSISDPDPNTLSANLTAKYQIISQFLLNNRLKLNGEKTQLLNY